MPLKFAGLKAFGKFQGDKRRVRIIFVLNVSENISARIGPMLHPCLPLSAKRTAVFRPPEADIRKWRR